MPILHTTEEILTKLELCRLLRPPIEDKEFNPVSFKDRVINSHATNTFLNEYAIYLYYYGIHIRRLYEILITPESHELSQKYDDIYKQGAEIRKQLIDILEKVELGEMPQFYFTNEQGKKRKLIASLEDEQEDLRELIITHYKETYCKLYNAEKQANEKVLTTKEITLGYLKDCESDFEKEYKKEVGGSMGRPVNIEMLFSHRCIQELSFLLKIDCLLAQERTDVNLSDINLNADDYRFIYNFLEYFSLLFYDKAEIVTTQPDDIIKSRYSSFGKGASLTAVVEEMTKIEDDINEYAVQYKTNHPISKGI